MSMTSSCSTTTTKNPVDYLKQAVKDYREELRSKGFSEAKFTSCLSGTVENLDRTFSVEPKQKAKCSCSCFFKSMWLLLLVILAFALLVAGYRPLSFWVHKVRCN